MIRIKPVIVSLSRGSNCQMCYYHHLHSAIWPSSERVLERTPVMLSVYCTRVLSNSTPTLSSPLSNRCRFNSTVANKNVSIDESSVRVDEVGKFENMSGSWWNHSSGQMKELHSMNKLRVPFIRDGILQQQQKHKDSNVPKPLEGFNILDIGCGGGILCEPLGRLGATVKGIDPGKENINVASTHLPNDLRGKVTYECVSVEELASRITATGEEGNDEQFDAVVMSEVIEHIEDQDSFIRTATELLKPGGSLFLTTVNRTTESWLGAIVAWEYLLRKLPVGTHDWKKFVTPQEIDRIFKSSGLRTLVIHGMCYNPLNNTWKWSNQRAINYAMHAVKNF